ncbi:natural cytotoxicity triggering receptor 2-like isoform X1 [Sapajus apella]|uniref:Natural cytotoxicity triggering receptor 2-like isoform X1 n=1 Tax=Sapajus apella TaxID=9515 RepID=A0A6J3FUU7_SAPAP|nr:natural cytotoxicity triggering receptor 2-like isoform X1 [Sapajus apella]
MPRPRWSTSPWRPSRSRTLADTGACATAPGPCIPCWASSWMCLQVESWCRKISANTCAIVGDSPRTVAWEPRYFIQDDHFYGNFTVTMTELREEASGFYGCGISQSPEISFIRIICLVVSQEARPSPHSSKAQAFRSRTNRTEIIRPWFRMNPHIRTVAGTARSARSKANVDCLSLTLLNPQG